MLNIQFSKSLVNVFNDCMRRLVMKFLPYVTTSKGVFHKHSELENLLRMMRLLLHVLKDLNDLDLGYV